MTHPIQDSQLSRVRYRAAKVALYTTIALTTGKIVVGIISHSVGVLSEGIHSSLDLVSAAVAFFTIREAGKPADHDHPYGHGKFETLSSLAESLLLIAAALFIVHEAVDHFNNPVTLTHEGAAVATILVSLIASYFAYVQNAKAAKITGSSAIEINSLHFLADAVASAAVLAALLVIAFTGWTWVDPTVALLVAVYIFAISWKQVKPAINDLLDSKLPENEVTKIENILLSFKNQMIEAHDLKTRKSGTNRLAEFHLIQCGKMTVEESHTLCDQIEEKIQDEFTGAQVTIHVEPCSHVHVFEPKKCPKSPDGKCAAFPHRGHK